MKPVFYIVILHVALFKKRATELGMDDSPNKFVEQAKLLIEKNKDLRLQRDSISAYNVYLTKVLYSVLMSNDTYSVIPVDKACYHESFSGLQLLFILNRSRRNLLMNGRELENPRLHVLLLQ